MACLIAMALAFPTTVSTAGAEGRPAPQRVWINQFN